MMKPDLNHNHEQVLELLETLQDIPERDPKIAAHGRIRFLAEARYHQKTVSLSPFQRLNKWMSEQFEMYALSLNALRKERTRMFTAISSLILAIAIMLGSGGATAFAAQESLPNDFLYTVKMFIEDSRFTFAASPESKVDLLVTFANNRVDEVLQLTSLGKIVPDSVVADLQADLDSMLQLAAAIEEGETQQGVLRQIRDRLRTQNYVMNMSGQPEDVDPTLEQLQHILQEQHQRAAAGVEDPLKFQHMFRNNQEEPAEDTTEAAEPTGKQNADCIEPGDCEPLKGYEWDDPGNENPGNLDPGNLAPGNAAPGNADPGVPGGNTDPGNAAPGNTDPGNTDPGNADPGNDEIGNTDPGNTDPGNTDPGNPDPGSGEPGDPDPGDPDPGDPDPGNGSGEGGKP